MDANELQELVKRYQDNKDFIENEETAKMALVVPFIRLLGYDTNMPREVRLEYCAPFAQADGKKLPDRMDFAIFDRSGTKPIMVIETKPLGTDLKAKSQQLARYIAQLPDLHFGIITDGCHYLFFGDLENPNLMDQDPFFTFSLEDSKTDWTKVAKFLSKFSRDAFNAETLVTDAENSRYRQAIIEKLANTLKSPTDDEDFLRWLTADVYKGKRTAAVMARMAELVKESIEPALLHFMGDEFVTKLKERIQRLRETPEVKQSGPDPAPAVSTSLPSDDKPTVETTQEELEFFGLVQSLMVAEGHAATDLLWKDTINYFNVSYKKPTKWFVRFFSGGKRRSLTTLVPVEEAKRIAPTFDVEESPATFGISRVFIEDISQVSQLKGLLLQSLQQVQGG